MVKIGIKNALFGYFCARFLKNYCHIWNQTPQINQIAKFHKKMKIAKFGTKYVLLSIFDQECLIWLFYGQNFLKNFCHIWNQHLHICIFAKFCEKTKMSKFGSKNVFKGYFWTRILKTLLSYLESEPSDLSKMSL